MRPTKDNTGANFTGTGAVIPKLPRDTDQITIGTAKYWKPCSSGYHNRNTEQGTH